MSNRDDSDDPANGASPYDEPTGSFRVPPAGLRRVDDLEDLDPDEVETRAFDLGEAHGRGSRRRNPVPAAQEPGMAPPTPTPRQETQALEVPEATAYSAAPDVAYSAVTDDEPLAIDGPAAGDGPTVIAERIQPGRGTLDLGLLLLRVTVGLIAMAHGAQKLFGWWSGPRLSGFEDFLVNSANTSIGFDPDVAKPLAILGAISELLGGLMLVLGLLTPLGAAAVLGVMIIATAFKATLAGGVWFFASGQAGPGIEYEVLLAVCAAAIILCGPGRISLDTSRGWARRPLWGSVVALMLGIAAAVAIWIVFNGTNPLQPR